VVREVDPISSFAVTIYAVATAVLVGIVNQLTVLPGTEFALSMSPEVATGVAVAAIAVAVFYNGVDLSQLGGVEVLVILVSVGIVLARRFVPEVSNFLDQFAPWSLIFVWALSGLALLIAAYGPGVEYWPIGGD